MIRLLAASLLFAISAHSSAQAAIAAASYADPGDKHLYAGQYDLDTNLWGVQGAGSGWSLTLDAPSSSSVDGAAYTWSGFAGSPTSVKAYASVRYGASNRNNDPALSGFPYRFGGNHTDVKVDWDFATNDGGGKYNHTLDVFFNATPDTKQSEIRGEIMIVTASSQDARTAGWGVKDGQPFVIGPETWEVWQATQVSHGHRWHVMQFRKHVNSTRFHHNLRDFFAEAAARTPDIFAQELYVMMVEAGTEIKTGAGQVELHRYKVDVRPAP